MWAKAETGAGRSARRIPQYIKKSRALSETALSQLVLRTGAVLLIGSVSLRPSQDSGKADETLPALNA